jgi:phosphoglycerate dehydrogenase-like enzyme
MRIVVIDDVGIGETYLARLEQHGDVTVCQGNPRDAEEVVARGRDADIVISGWSCFDATVLAKLRGLRLLSLWATGLDNVDLVAAAKRGVAVCNVPSYATNAVAELTLGLTLAVMRRIPAADRAFRETRRANWRPFRGAELCGRTLGVVGTGLIGSHVARFGHAFGMNLLGYDVRNDQTLAADTGLRYTSLGELFAASDVVTLHAPLSPQTTHLVDRSLLATMRPNAFIVNAARAGLINQDDLYEALAQRTIAGAGLDVIDLSLQSGPRLLTLDNVVVTPHIGFFTEEALGNLTAGCVDNVVRFLEGTPVNLVVAQSPG